MTAVPPRPAAPECEDECSDTCTRNICEWCPEADRQAAMVAEFRARMDEL